MKSIIEAKLVKVSDELDKTPKENQLKWLELSSQKIILMECLVESTKAELRQRRIALLKDNQWNFDVGLLTFDEYEDIKMKIESLK